MQGWRNTMEDSHIAEVDLGNGVSFFGVYDGHGGMDLFFDTILTHIQGNKLFTNMMYRK
jgi:hypothetical protein